VLKCELNDKTKTGTVDVSVVFYKYIQRARIVKSRRMTLLVAAGAFEIKPPLYYVRQSQGFLVPSAIVIKIESLLQSLFGKAFRVQFFNISQLAELAPNKMNARVVQSIDYFLQTKSQIIARYQGKRA